MDDSDAVLVGRARGGDAGAFGTLVERHLSSAYAVALARTGERADAEDICQDAFIIALERLDQCREPDRFGGWLLTIVRNRAEDQRRAGKVRAALPLEFAALATDGSNPERDAERSELRDELLRAMEGLTDLQREVLLMFDFEGWTHREIAGKVGITEGSARVHLHNARRALRERLPQRSKEDG